MAEETPKPPEAVRPGDAPEPETSTSPADKGPAQETGALPTGDAPAQPAPGETAPGQPQQPGPQVPGAQLAPEPVHVGTSTMSPDEKPSGVAPLVLGILSIVLSGIIGIVLGIIGLSKSKKVLAADAGNGKAKAGKVTSIIGLVLSIVVTVAVIASIALGCSIFGNLTGGAQAAADEAVSSIVTPSDEDRQQIMDEFESGFESAGMSLDDLGLTVDDIASWMFDGASYTMTGIQVADDQAVVTYSVTTNKFDTLLDALYDGVSELDYSKISSMGQAYKEVGKVMKSAMDSSTPSTKEIDVYVSNDGSGWAVDDTEMESLLYDIFYYE